MSYQRRPGLLAAAVLLLLGARVPSLGAQPVEQASDQTIRVDVNLVTLRFTVRTPEGQLVNTLNRDAFRILESGIPQELVFFESPRNRSGETKLVWLAFLIDVSGSTFSTRAEEIVAASTFLDNVTNATQIGIFGFTDVLIPFQDFTSSRELVLKAFREARKHLGRTALYDTLNALIAKLNSEARPGAEKAVIVISDGLDDRYQQSTATISRARSSGVRLHTILVPSAAQIYIGPSSDTSQDPHSVNRPDAARLDKEQAFAELSIQTGGRHFSGFEAILDFDATMAQINDELFGNLYTLGYYSDYPYDRSEVPNLDILVSPPSLQTSAPFKKWPQQLAPKRSLIAALFDNAAIRRMSSAPTRQFHEIGAEMDVLPPRREGTLVGLPFRIKVSPYNFPGATRAGISTQLGVIGLLIDQEGKEIVRLREIFHVNLGAKEIREGRAIIYSNKLLAPPGAYELKVALLELATWRLTSFERSVRISAP